MRTGKRRPKISFRVFGDSGPLSANFHSGTLGDAVEAVSGDGVGFFLLVSRELFAIEFDDVSHESDYQVLKFKRGITVEVRVRKGQATIKVHQPKKQKSA